MLVVRLGFGLGGAEVISHLSSLVRLRNLLSVHAKPQPFHFRSSSFCDRGPHKDPLYPIQPVSSPLAWDSLHSLGIALGTLDMACIGVRHIYSRSPDERVSWWERRGACLMLTFKGELAEDSLDVPPSYIPAFMSADIMYD